MITLEESIAALQQDMLSHGYSIPEFMVDGPMIRFSRGNNPKEKNGWIIARIAEMTDGSQVIRCLYGDIKKGEYHICLTYNPFKLNSKLNDDERILEIERLWR